MKHCSHCKKTYPYANFHKNKSKPDGYANTCKMCFKEISDTYRLSALGKETLATRKQRPEHIEMMLKSRRKYGRSEKAKVANTRYAHTEKFKIVQKRYQAKHYEEMKPRLRAQWAVKDARRQGKMPNPATLLCQCGAPAVDYHHHLGYAEEHRLSVIPVCPTCHGKEHRKYD